jgi:hypothetical protein
MCDRAGVPYNPNWTMAEGLAIKTDLSARLDAVSPMTLHQARHLHGMCSRTGRDFDPRWTIAQARALITELQAERRAYNESAPMAPDQAEELRALCDQAGMDFDGAWTINQGLRQRDEAKRRIGLSPSGDRFR